MGLRLLGWATDFLLAQLSSQQPRPSCLERPHCGAEFPLKQQQRPPEALLWDLPDSQLLDKKRKE